MEYCVIKAASSTFRKAQQDLAAVLEREDYVNEATFGGLAAECVRDGAAMLMPGRLWKGALTVGGRLGGMLLEQAVDVCSDGLRLVVCGPEEGGSYAIAALAGRLGYSQEALCKMALRPVNKIIQLERDMMYWRAFCNRKLPGSIEDALGTQFDRPRFERLYDILKQDKKAWGSQQEIDLDIIFGERRSRPSPA
jgi:hypothetical protein